MSLATMQASANYEEHEIATTTVDRALRYGNVAGWDDNLRFKAVVTQWESDSLLDSLPDAMKSHASYRDLISFGGKAIPLIAAQLRSKPSFLFLALEDLTRHDPVPEEAYGDLSATVRAWLAWLQR